MREMRVLAIGLALAVTFGGRGGAARAQAAAVDPEAALMGRLDDIARQHHGRVALYATQLNTGRVVAIDADQVVQTASVIKLTVLFEAMEQVRAGKAHWDDKVALKPGDAVSGSGVLMVSAVI